MFKMSSILCKSSSGDILHWGAGGLPAVTSTQLITGKDCTQSTLSRTCTWENWNHLQGFLVNVM